PAPLRARSRQLARVAGARRLFQRPDGRYRRRAEADLRQGGYAVDRLRARRVARFPCRAPARQVRTSAVQLAARFRPRAASDSRALQVLLRSLPGSYRGQMIVGTKDSTVS